MGTSFRSLSYLTGLVIFGFAIKAYAIDPCSLIGVTTFSPQHPGQEDSVGYHVALPAFLFEATPGRLIATRSSISPGVVQIDVVLTDTLSEFPGYKPVNVKYSADSNFEFLPLLAVGSYEVRTDVRSYDAQQGKYVSVCAGVFPKITTLTVSAIPRVTQTAPVVEFYNAKLDHYFITQNDLEVRDLDNNVHPGWSRTGQSFTAYRADASDGRGAPVCRWYGLPSAGLDTHMVSGSLVECNAIATDALTVGRWVLEAQDVFEVPLPDMITGACPARTVPVYRLWNNRPDSNHRYTADLAIKNAMVAKGYVPEGFGPDGVAMCAVAS